MTKDIVITALWCCFLIIHGVGVCSDEEYRETITHYALNALVVIGVFLILIVE